MTVAIASDPGAAELEETTPERAVVGALLLAPAEQQLQLLAAVDDREFGDAQCRWVVGVIREMAAAGRPVDQVTVAAYVLHTGRLALGTQRQGLASLMFRLTQDAPGLSAALWYADAVREGFARREALLLARRLTEAAQGGSFADLAAVALSGSARLLRALDRAESGVLRNTSPE